MTRKERRNLFKQAGIQPSEVRYDPDLGEWLINASAVRKLCALKPSYNAAALLEQVASVQRQRLRVIDGGSDTDEVQH